MKLAMIALLALIVPTPAPAQRDSLLVVSWNVENFFDWTDSGGGDSDREFSPEGAKHWTKSRFYRKCEGIAKVLLAIADRHGRLPDAVAFEEVENRFVLRQLLNSTALRKLDYGIVHYDSPDHRGIDCGLIYRKSTLRLESSGAKHVYDSSGAVMATRDLLLAQFTAYGGERLAVVVNHHPSKVGGKADRRVRAMKRMVETCDSLEAAKWPFILCVGDFNDDVWGTGGQGTIKYNGAWEKIDGHFARGVTVKERVYDSPLLLTRDAAFGGLKPLRTYSGPRWLGGLSDHLPIVLTVFF